MKKLTKKFDSGRLIIELSGIVMLLVVLIHLYLLIVDPKTAFYIIENHTRHYLVGLTIGLFLNMILWKKLNMKQHIIYILLPCIIAAGYPDLVYFFSYLFQHGTFIGVLGHKNLVYRIMHYKLVSLSAGPILTGLVYYYDQKLNKGKRVKKYIFIILMIAVMLSSLLHVIFDVSFGF